MDFIIYIFKNLNKVSVDKSALKILPNLIVLRPDQNLVPIGVTKLYCDFQLDTYMRGLNMYDGLFRTVA